jgi:hypothetical protein
MRASTWPTASVGGLVKSAAANLTAVTLPTRMSAINRLQISSYSLWLRDYAITQLIIGLILRDLSGCAALRLCRHSRRCSRKRVVFLQIKQDSLRNAFFEPAAAPYIQIVSIKPAIVAPDLASCRTLSQKFDRTVLS